MNHRNLHRLRFWIFFGILALVVVNSAFFVSRVDLTSEKTFSLSSVSKDLFSRLESPVRITYYLSPQLHQVSPLPQLITDYLKEYAYQSGGKVLLQILDPVVAGLADQMSVWGIEANPLSLVEANQQSVVMVYSGIRFEYLDREQILPLIFQIEGLEYELTSHVKILLTQRVPKIGILLGDDSQTLETHYKSLISYLNPRFRLFHVSRNEEVDPSLDALIVAGHRSLTSLNARGVERYLQGGGKVLFALDGAYVDSTGVSAPAKAQDTPLMRLISQYGLKLHNQWVLDLYARPIQFQTNQGLESQSYPPWIEVLAENSRSEHLVTQRFTGLDLFWASPLSLEGVPPTLKAQVLLSSSSHSWLMDNLDTDLKASLESLGQAREGQKSYPLAYTIEGRFPGLETGQLSPETRALVIGDSDFFTDILETAQSPYNISFLENALEWLSQDDDLLSLKPLASKNRLLHPFRDESGLRWAAFTLSFVNMGLIPLGVILGGLTWWLVRKNRQQRGANGKARIQR